MNKLMLLLLVSLAGVASLSAGWTKFDDLRCAYNALTKQYECNDVNVYLYNGKQAVTFKSGDYKGKNLFCPAGGISNLKVDVKKGLAKLGNDCIQTA